MIHPLPKKPLTTNYYKSTSALNPRLVEEDNFPVNGKTSEQLEFLLNYAVLDPSIYNTQPWVFKIIDRAIELYANTRVSATADPNYRELIISCGIALFDLRIAIRYFGYRDIVEVFPEPYNPNLLARISFGSKRIVQLEEKFLFRAISKRSTDRFYLANRNLPKSLISELESVTDSECTRLQILTSIVPDSSRREVIKLVDKGDRLQTRDPWFRQKLSQWISSSHEDIPMASSVATLMLIGSQNDNDYAWLATGEALGHLLLRARIDDVKVSCLNRPIQVPELRSRLQALFPDRGYPQVLLRLCYQ